MFALSTLIAKYLSTCTCFADVPHCTTLLIASVFLGMCYSLSHVLTGAATDVCFSPSNNMLMISVGMDAKIKCYDIQTRKYDTLSFSV